jgi:preprotein translocase SecE subunit
VARDRQRAKQRKARRAQDNPGPRSSQPLRENVPGELEHASGEVEEFEAALVAGADGQPVTAGARPDEVEREDIDELDDDAGDAAAAAATTPAHRERRREAREAERRAGLLARFFVFLRASWAELQRVQWPDRRQVTQATAVVIGFVIVAGAYLGLADYVANKVVNFII